MKNTKRNKSQINIFGFKVSSNTLASIIIIGICAIILVIGTTYRSHKLSCCKTETVTAQIIDVGTRWRGGSRLSKKGFIKIAYFINGKKTVRYIDSIKILDNMDNYRIGDCIELLISLEDENIYKWNEVKGTFKCE